MATGITIQKSKLIGQYLNPYNKNQSHHYGRKQPRKTLYELIY